MTSESGAPVGQTFPFPVGLQAYHRSAQDGYVSRRFAWFVAATGTTNDVTASAYSLSAAQPLESSLSPLLTDTTLIVNNQKEQPNPLRGVSFQDLGLLGINPVVARSDAQRSYVYVYGAAYTPRRMWSVVNVDAAGNPGEIIALAANERAPGNTNGGEVLIIGEQMSVFTGIRPVGQPFGAAGSCIGVNMFLPKQEAAEKKEREQGDLELCFVGHMPLDMTNAMLRIGAPLANMQDRVTLYVDTRLEKLFVGVGATGGAASDDGVIAALVRGSALNDLITQIVPGALVEGDRIVAAKGSSSQITLYNLRVIHTTTGLPFLLVHGGVGDQDMAIRSLYALPILTQTGMLASVNAPPVTLYTDQGFPRIRIWQTPPTSAADLYTPQSIPARVGGGPLPAPITAVFTFGDAVFAATSAVAADSAPGLWCSQAIFERDGSIIMWTPWKRAGGAQAALPIYGFSLDVRAGTFWFTTGSSLVHATIARKNAWGSQSGIAALVTGLFTQQQKSGVQGVTELPATDQRIALSIMTGYRQVLLTQSEQVTGGVRAPRTDYGSGYQSANGTLEGFVPGVSWLYCSGGALDVIGAILSAAVVSDDTYSWIVVAGTNGVAVLARDDGSGWNTNDGLRDGFEGLDASMQWRVVPLYYSGMALGAIRKILFDNNHLYILANAGLFRIAPQQTLFAQQATPVELTSLFLASTFSAYASCVDCFIAGPLAIVASSVGVFRSGNSVDISTVARANEARWQRIVLPYAPGPVGQIAVMSSVQHENDTGLDANLMLLGSYVGLQQARLYRAVVRHTGVVTDDTVRLFLDELAKDMVGFFLSVGDYRNGVITNGAVLGFSRSRYLQDAPFFEIIAPEWTVWPRSVGLGLFAVRAAYDAVTAASATSIYAPTISGNSGSWLVYGDRGLATNE